MAAFTNTISNLNQMLNSILWGRGMLLCFLLVGFLFTVGTRFFQVRWLSKWMRLTVGSLFARKGGRQKLPAHSITPFQALSTALAAAIGTGNIVGVAIALSTGGPGAIFWMWASAFLGMMTSFAEKTLGIRYRYPDAKNRWVGGAMVYMEKGLHCKWMALLFAALCIPVSFGMGNLSQSNSMAQAMKNAFGVSPQSDRSSGGHIDWNYLARRYQTHCRRDGKTSSHHGNSVFNSRLRCNFDKYSPPSAGGRRYYFRGFFHSFCHRWNSGLRHGPRTAHRRFNGRLFQ